MKFPIVSRFLPKVTDQQLAHAKSVAGEIGKKNPQLDWTTDDFRACRVAQPLEDLPTLQLADFSEVPVIGKFDSSAILQQRARLRAGDGDWVAQSKTTETGFSEYCEHNLGLGHVNWIYPSDTSSSNPLQIAFECWQDRQLRRKLVHAIRQHGLRYIHPHVSTLYVWELASLLSGATRLPIHVIGPTPAMSRWANNKIEFAAAVSQLFGEQAVPRTECAYNFATLARKVLDLSAACQRIGIKYPYGTGGSGNFLIHASEIRGMSLLQVRAYLKKLLSSHQWPRQGRILIDIWETEVISSPSVQIWIPPLGLGEPIIEGLFDQRVSGPQGAFVGSCPAELPAEIGQRIVDRSYLLTCLLQRLGYVGRCSFDLILVGKDLADCRIEFIECNARWGGTSIPMSLMNRLGIVDQGRTYGVRRVKVTGLDQVDFPLLIRDMGNAAFSVESQLGQYIFFNPARLKAQSAIEVIAIGDSRKAVDDLLQHDLPNRLRKIVAHRTSPYFSSKPGFESTSNHNGCYP